jgi:hypothetical protein
MTVFISTSPKDVRDPISFQYSQAERRTDQPIASFLLLASRESEWRLAAMTFSHQVICKTVLGLHARLHVSGLVLLGFVLRKLRPRAWVDRLTRDNIV